MPYGQQPTEPPPTLISRKPDLGVGTQEEGLRALDTCWATSSARQPRVPRYPEEGDPAGWETLPMLLLG